MFFVRNARVPLVVLPASFSPPNADRLEPWAAVDIGIEAETIVSVVSAGAPPLPAPDVSSIDVKDELVFPGFIDCHTHLDKTHTWYRAPNRTGTFLDALETVHRDHVNWNADDVALRADFALRCAWAHGTRAIRTHIDTFVQRETSHAVMAELRKRWQGRIEIQTVPLCGVDLFLTTEGERVANLALDFGASALGGFARSSANLAPALDRLLSIAGERRVGLDLHIDETEDASAHCLRAVAEAVLRADFPHQVNCGHCCSLARQSTSLQQATLDLVKAAGLGVISLPMCNLYLQDRRTEGFPKTPSWRGITLVRDFLDAGIPVACASDNVRDAFFPYGDYDMTEVLVQSIRIAHLDSNLDQAVQTVTGTPAELMGLNRFGTIRPGSAASLIALGAKSFSELLSRPRPNRRRIEGEIVHSPTVPDYLELESLLES